MKKSPFKTLKIGDILEIPVCDNKFSYCQVGPSPLFIFYGGLFSEWPGIESLFAQHILFKLWVYKEALKNKRWKKICSADISEEHLESPDMRKQDIISGRLSIYNNKLSETNFERRANFSEVKDLEAAAVWEMSHVEDRIRDFYLGRSNKWEDDLKIDIAKVPRDQML